MKGPLPRGDSRATCPPHLLDEYQTYLMQIAYRWVDDPVGIEPQPPLWPAGSYPRVKKPKKFEGPPYRGLVVLRAMARGLPLKAAAKEAELSYRKASELAWTAAWILWHRRKHPERYLIGDVPWAANRIAAALDQNTKARERPKVALRNYQEAHAEWEKRRASEWKHTLERFLRPRRSSVVRPDVFGRPEPDSE